MGGLGSHDTAREGAKTECIAAKALWREFVAGVKDERTQNSVDSAGGVGHEHHVIRFSAQELRQRRSRRVPMAFQIAREKLERLAFETRAPFALRLQHGLRTRAKSAMIQERDVWKQRSFKAWSNQILTPVACQR